MRLLACFFLFVCTVAKTVAQQLSLENYTPANGLVDARVTKMFQDSKGLIYFLTREGFSIFDGQHFDNYGNTTIGTTEIINGIAEYNNEVVKLFTFDGNVYSIKENKVILDTLNQKLLSEVNTVFSIAPDDKIIVTNSFIIREQHGKYKKLNTGFKKGTSLSVDNTLLAKPYLLLSHNLVSSTKKIYLYNYETETVVDSLANNSFSNSSIDKEGNCFIHTNKWLQIKKEALQKGKIEFMTPAFSNYLPKTFANSSLYFSDTETLWAINANNGYCKINLKSKFTTYYNQLNGVFGNAGFVFMDAEKNNWLISIGNGVQKIQQSPLSKVNIKNVGFVRNLNIDEQGNSFIQAAGGYFVNEKKINGATINLTRPSYYYQNQYWQFLDYKTLKSSNGKLFNIDKYLPKYKPEDFQLSSFSTIDKDGRLLIAGNTLFVLDKQLNFYAYKPPYFADNVIVDKENNYWLFMRSNTVSKLSWKDGKLVQTYFVTTPNLSPRSGVLWNDSVFVMGTRLQGIKFFSLINKELKETSSLTKQNGLSNNFIYTLLKKNNQLIVGTGSGLDLITINNTDTVIENISLRNSIFSTFGNTIFDKDSSVLCLNSLGSLYRLTNENIHTSGYIPQAYFKSIFVNGTPVDTNAVFSYNKNNFSFSVSAPSYLDNKSIKYNFVLASDNQEWQQNNTSADFVINNLLPGNYNLKITVQYSGKFYPNQILTYSFVIKKPFWKQWWFICLAILIATVTGFYLIKNYYTRQLEKQKAQADKKQAIEKERTRIATDMHDDFGASLSRIKFISEKIQLTKREDGSLKNDLLKISSFSDEMAEKMNEIVWALNQRYDSLDDLISFSRAYAADYLQDKNIAFEFSTSDILNKKILGEIRRNIFMVIKEALHNIIKHAKATKVSIQFIQGKQLIVIIKDNGKGINFENIRPFANGLENMKKRIAEINGELIISNDNGTAIQINVLI